MFTTNRALMLLAMAQASLPRAQPAVQLLGAFAARKQAAPARAQRKTTLHAYHGKRAGARYARQHADERQRNSHKPGTLRPRHIFGGAL